MNAPSNPVPAIVRADSLVRRFGAIAAVDHLTFSIAHGEIFAVVGPDGAGKTTLARLLCGVIGPTSGDAFVTGCSVANEPEKVKSHIGYMPQRFSLYPDLTLIENLDFYADLYEVPRTRYAARSAQLLADFEIDQFKSRLAGALSGGMKQKLALACTLIHDPDLLLLDEPTAGVDPISRRRFWRLLYQLNDRGKTIVVNTPYMDEAEHAGRVALMFRGAFVACATPARLKEEMGAEVLEITVGDTSASRRALSELPCVQSIELFGARLHALVKSAESARPLVVARLAERGFSDAVVRRVEPSLEDAFVALIGVRERAA
jgi:ABC-2 type transport system ATP-binding protein